MQQGNYQGHVGGPIMYEDGAVYSGKGKYRIDIPGSSIPKEITWRVVIIGIVVALALLMITTLLAGKQPKYFPNEIEMLNAIGQPLVTATLKMGVSPGFLTEKEPGVYFANQGIILDGVAFDLYFYEDAGRLSGFAYIAEYQAEPKKAANDIYNTLINLRITTYVPSGETESVEVTKKNLREYLEGDNLLKVKATSNFTPSDPNDPIMAYMKALENAGDWEGSVSGYRVRKAMLYQDKGATYDPKSQKVQLVLSYRIEPEREVKYMAK